MNTNQLALNDDGEQDRSGIVGPAAIGARTGRSERRQFRMHAQLLYDVILRQAGSLAKAFLEGVMNSVDANASHVELWLNEDRALVVDDGEGFKSRREIEDWFEEFGHPHDPSEKNKFGKFRMGRGQLFAFGVNLWRSGEFAMWVDIKHEGLGYELHEGMAPAPGCRIEIKLYEPALPSLIDQTSRQLRLWCKYIPIPVRLNGEPLSRAASTCQWTEETEDAWIKLDNTSTLYVYNQGAFVVAYPKWQFGVGGEVVSKVPLQVNFARNDIQSTCEVWRRLKSIVDKTGRAKTIRKPSLDEGERESLCVRAGRDELSPKELADLRIFTAVTGQHVTLYDVLRCERYQEHLTSAPKGNQIGDHIHRQHLAFVMAEETLAHLGLSDIPAFLDWAKRIDPKHEAYWGRARYIPFEQIAASMKNRHVLIPEEDLTAVERIWKKALNELMPHVVIDEGGRDRRIDRRTVFIGESEADLAWTDGVTFIAVSREYLFNLSMDLSGLISLAGLMLHEFCHREPDLVDEHHSQTFFELYHDNHDDFVNAFVRNGLRELPRCVDGEIKRCGEPKRTPGKLLNSLDQVAKLERTEKKANDAFRSQLHALPAELVVAGRSQEAKKEDKEQETTPAAAAAQDSDNR